MIRTPGAAWRAAPRAARIAAALALVLMCAVPVVLSALRAGEFESSVRMERAPASATPEFVQALPFPGGGAGYVARQLDTDATRIGIVAELSFLIDEEQLRGAFEVVERLGPLATIRARADTPGRARELARVAGLEVVAASSREVDAAAAAAFKRVRSRLTGAEGGERAMLVRRAAVLRRVLDNPPSRVNPVTEPTVPALNGVDEFVDGLPGPFPPRPSPLLAALAGLLLGLVSAWALLALGFRSHGA